MYPLDCSADIYVLKICSELKITLQDVCYCNHEIIPVHWTLTLEAPAPQIGQTHSNNSSAFADELFESVWPFCGVGA